MGDAVGVHAVYEKVILIMASGGRLLYTYLEGEARERETKAERDDRRHDDRQEDVAAATG